jgi:hypothetical protein
MKITSEFNVRGGISSVITAVFEKEGFSLPGT